MTEQKHISCVFCLAVTLKHTNAPTKEAKKKTAKLPVLIVALVLVDAIIFQSKDEIPGCWSTLLAVINIDTALVLHCCVSKKHQKVPVLCHTVPTTHIAWYKATEAQI